MVKCDAGGKKGKRLSCKRIFDRIKATVNWPRSSLKITKMSQNAFFAKSSRSQCVKIDNYQSISIIYFKSIESFLLCIVFVLSPVFRTFSKLLHNIDSL